MEREIRNAARAATNPFRVLVSLLLLLALAVGLCWFFWLSFEQPGLVAEAQTLVGKPASAAREVLGRPDRTMKADTFNAEERAAVAYSFNPDPPPAAGSVWIYNRTPLIIIIYLERDSVRHVYIGRT